MARDAGESAGRGKLTRSMGVELAKFAVFAAVTVVAAWMAATGRVAYIVTMLVIAAALGYAVLDCVGYELVKKRRPR